MKEIIRVYCYRFTDRTEYIVEYIDGNAEVKTPETFFEGKIISDAVQNRTVFRRHTHNCETTIYKNPKYHCFDL